MKIAVVGPGAIGCLFASLLGESRRHEVWLVDKRPERAEHIAREGIRVEGVRGKRHVAVPATVDPGRVGKADLVCICVKAYDVASAIATAEPLLDGRTRVLSLQNGLGNIETISQRVPLGRIVAGATTFGALCLGPGHIRHTGEGSTTIGPAASEGREAAATVAEIFAAAGIETILTGEVTSLLWSKLIINAAICPLSAISGLPNGRLPGHAEWGPTLRAAAQEAAAVARAMNIVLLYRDPVRAVLKVCRRTAENVSSMLQDIRRGKQTEIEAINGAVLREARRLGIPAPTIERLYREVKRLQAGGNIESRSELRV